MLLLRLCPLVPYNAFNYIMGITSVSLFAYAVGNFGMLPATIVYVFIGTTVGSLTDLATGNYDAGVVPLIFLIVGSIGACGIIIYVSFKVKAYLNQFTDIQEEEDIHSSIQEQSVQNSRNS